MEITKEYLEQQISAFEAQRDAYMANAHASNGAMQACQQLVEWLERVDSDEPDAIDVPGIATPIGGTDA